ncbi:MAG TPA: hypothetical protein VGE74_20885, partial [Gemmata sp.]
MRRWFAAPVVLFASIGFASLSAPRAAAEIPAPEAESFLTADGVQLKGVFHATDKTPGAAPVVVLMYPPGPDRDMTKGDWVKLAKLLNENGYHAFRFDWRGHGKSNDIKDPRRFWENPYLNGPFPSFNGHIRGAGKKPLKNELAYKDLTKPERYFPAYLNDLAAVRVHLDTKNDNKTVNTSSIYLIGAGDAATLGMAWLAAEWQRPGVFPNPGLLGLNVPGYEFVPQPLNVGGGAFPAEGGQDISGAVWLSASRPTTVSETVVKRFITTSPKIRENNPMLFLYADKDAAGKKHSEFFFNEVLIANPKKSLMLNPLEQTFIKEVKGGAQLRGVQ